MSDFINKKTFRIEKSIHDPLRNTNPDYALYDGHSMPEVSRKYWVWNNALGKHGQVT